VRLDLGDAEVRALPERVGGAVADVDARALRERVRGAVADVDARALPESVSGAVADVDARALPEMLGGTVMEAVPAEDLESIGALDDVPRGERETRLVGDATAEGDALGEGGAVAEPDALAHMLAERLDDALREGSVDTEALSMRDALGGALALCSAVTEADGDGGADAENVAELASEPETLGDEDAESDTALAELNGEEDAESDTATAELNGDAVHVALTDGAGSGLGPIDTRAVMVGTRLSAADALGLSEELGDDVAAALELELGDAEGGGECVALALALLLTDAEREGDALPELLGVAFALRD
jgi:hypothetical protein